MNEFQKRVQKACFTWEETRINIHCLMMDYEGPNVYRIHIACEKFFTICKRIIECGNDPTLWNLIKALIYTKIADFYFQKLKNLGLL